MDDARLLRVLEDVSRAADRHCGRHFYAERGIRFADANVADRDVLWLPFDVVDLDSVTVDGVALDSSDYQLWPAHRTPKIRVDRVDGAAWPVGRRRIVLTGTFGYSCDVADTGQALTADVNEVVTAFPVADGSAISVGETLLVGAEQVYVRAVAAESLTVARGVNRTLAAAHVDGDLITRRVYPADLERAVLMQASRFFRDTQTGYSGMAGGGEYGGYSFTSSYPAIRDLLAHFVYQAVL